MFDDLNIAKEIKIPGFPKNQNRDFQTKDLECQCHRFEVSPEGRLTLTINRKAGTRISVDQNFHGMLNFYALLGDRWFEYNAKFTDGKLVSVKRVKEE
jgi:hypothetical protein